ncbi:MAG: hypothetical protein DMG96_13350 [Acidobacteria bacterium]|nr:MAG: hypothetical protein DMG96_13350 [Acidobacteriota bacterium]
MAANTGQGRGFVTFLVGFTVTCAGLYLSNKLLLGVGLIVVLVSLFQFLKLKPLEGKTAQGPSPIVMKLFGAFLAALGWGITLFGMHLTGGTTGRIVLALVGIGVSLFGMIYVLPAAFNKNAIWKA